jgi:hypothetical protein
VRYREQLHWGTDHEGKAEFLRQSQRWRNWLYAGMSMGLVLFCGVSYLGWEQFKVWQNKRDLASWRQPAALYDYQNQLTSLSLNSSQLTHLLWLHHCFQELSFRTPLLDGLSDLPGCSGLTSLTLDLGDSGVTSLDALKELRGLTSLTLNLRNSGVTSLDALKELKSLTSLTLDLGYSTINALVIRDLGALKTLTITQNNHYELDGLSKSITTLRLSDGVGELLNTDF